CAEGDNLTINCLFVDSLGGLWIGTDNAFHRLDSEYHEYLGSSVTSIIEDGAANIWIGTRGDGVLCYVRSSGEILKFDNVGECEHLFLDSQNILWVCCRDSRMFMYSFAENVMKQAAVNWSGCVQQRVMSIVEDDNSDLWLATWDSGMAYLGELLVSSDDGLLWYQTQTGDSSLYSAQRFAYPILFDSEAGLWVGSYYGGLYFSSNNSGQFDSFPLEINGESSIVSCLCEDDDGTVWAGSDNFGLIHFSPKDGSIINRYLPDNNVHALLIDGDYLWVGSYAGGLHRLDRRTGAVKQFFTGSVYAIHIDINDEMWLGTMEDIRRFDREAGVVTETHVVNDNIYAIEETADGFLWFATNTKGLIRYSLSEGEWSEFNRSSGLPGEHVNCLYVSEGDNLFVGTSSGLAGLADASGSFINYAFSTGRNIQYVTSDGTNLWCATTEGLCRYNIPTGESAMYFVDDGLSSLQFMSGSGISTTNGRIALGTAKGVCAFYPYSIHFNDYIPPVLITRFRVREKSRKASGLPAEYVSVEQLDGNVFTHNQNNFIFSFASLSYTSPAKNRYMFMLEGFDEQWRESEGTRAEYTNIPAGKYTFRVKASNNDGVWNNEGGSVSFVIRPHILRSKGAMLFYLVLILFATYLLGRYLQEKINKMSEEKYNTFVKEFEENERARRDKDMVEKLKEIVSDNIANADLSADYLAKELCVSRSGLFSKVKEVTGKTPHDLIMEQRLEAAVKLLDTTDMSVSDISTMVGFNSPSYFSKCFTKAKGKSPYQWRS
ncbi:MAG: two-component regulator propeller domain-containing protein, partial [Bacteroidia bacterium]|nr:two-component regulator propeller domain-containing protein [Bacteroidia bacterium]